MLERVGHWFDRRLGASRAAHSTLKKAFPDHWSFLLGEIAMYAFAVLVITGIFLALFFEPSTERVVYAGSFEPLRGAEMSAAYASVLDLSFDIRGGLLIRQMHHWAALVFVGAIVLHLCRVFFTGAFRKPRDVNWVVGVTMLVLAVTNGFTGYSMPDDILSGTGIRITYSLVLSIPLVGDWLASLIFGGPFPGEQTISRFFVVHTLLVPLLIIGLLGAHLAIMWRQKHTQFPGKVRTERRLVGPRLWPNHTVKTVGLFALVAGVITLLGGVAQINPVWVYGPYDPYTVTTAAHPDFYLSYVDGILRLAPPWDLTVFGWLVPELFLFPVAIPLLTLGLLYAWPFLERRVTGDRRVHHLLDRPLDHPARTAFGVAALSFFGVLTVASFQDVLALELRVAVESLVVVLRVLLLVVPLVAAGVVVLLGRIVRQARAEEADAAGSGFTDPGQPPRDMSPGKRPGAARRVARVVAGGLIALITRRRWRQRSVSSDATTPDRPAR
jgi:ubiquinol-cytochrome c reductase cytochrome b subunit